MVDKIDDLCYFWKVCLEDGYFKISLNDDVCVEFGEIILVMFFISVS